MNQFRDITMLVLIILALFARRMKASPLLPAICLVGLATESLARLLML